MTLSSRLLIYAKRLSSQIMMHQIKQHIQIRDKTIKDREYMHHNIYEKCKQPVWHFYWFIKNDRPRRFHDLSGKYNATWPPFVVTTCQQYLPIPFYRPCAIDCTWYY